MSLTFVHPGQERIDAVLRRILESVGQPLTITSGYRSPKHNHRVGGSRGSMHVHGKAADISLAGMSEAERLSLMQRLRDAGIARFGLYSGSPNMLHVDLSTAQGPNHYMYDRTFRNMGSAPAYYQKFAGYEGSASPRVVASATPAVGASIPDAGMDIQNSMRESVSDAPVVYGLTPDQQLPSARRDYTQATPMNPYVDLSQGRSGMDATPYAYPAPPAPPEIQQPTGFGALMMDPIMAMGLGMLTSSMAGGNFAQALQAGMLGGQANILAMQRLQERQADRQYKYDLERYRFDTEQAKQARALEMLRQAGAPDEVIAMYGVAPDAVTDAFVKDLFEEPEVQPTIPQDWPADIQQQIAGGTMSAEDAAKVVEARRKEEDSRIAALRKEYDKSRADPKGRLQFWNAVRDIDPAQAENSSADQRTFIVSFAKMMEPTAAVMANDEDALMQAATKLPGVRDLIRRAWKGGLNRDEIADLKNRMRENAALATQEGAETWQRYQELTEAAAGPERVREVVGRSPPGMLDEQIKELQRRRMLPTPSPGTDIGDGFSVGGS